MADGGAQSVIQDGPRAVKLITEGAQSLGAGLILAEATRCEGFQLGPPGSRLKEACPASLAHEVNAALAGFSVVKKTNGVAQAGSLWEEWRAKILRGEVHRLICVGHERSAQHRACSKSGRHESSRLSATEDAGM